MTPFLFVYGTLCPDCQGALGSRERLRLAKESTVVGSASVRGRMVDLGTYPGLVDGPGRVDGLVLRLTRPAVTLAWLDAYELATGPGAEYERAVTLTLTPSLTAADPAPSVATETDPAADRDADFDDGVLSVPVPTASSCHRVWLYRLRALPKPVKFIRSSRWTGRGP